MKASDLSPTLQPIVILNEGDPMPFDGFAMTRKIFETYENERQGHLMCLESKTGSCPSQSLLNYLPEFLAFGLICFVMGKVSPN